MANYNFRRWASTIVLLSFSSILILSFQNCGAGFGSKSLESVSLAELGSAEIDLKLTNGQGQILNESTELIVDAPYRLSIDGFRLPTDSVVTWNASVTEGGGVHVHNGTALTDGELHCEAPGIITVSATIVNSRGTFQSRPLSLSCSEPPDTSPTPPPPPNPQIITFRIPAGTARSPWNTVATSVRVFVGQTLRIVNDDTIAHRLHTGGAPCPHQPVASAPGASFDCIVSRPLAATAVLYDHNVGTSARFYVTSIDGPALYTTNCQSCHGVRAASTVRNMTAAEIRNALNTVQDMRAINLTDDQVAAIAYSLSR